jgi:hypothetical protein
LKLYITGKGKKEKQQRSIVKEFAIFKNITFLRIYSGVPTAIGIFIEK